MAENRLIIELTYSNRGDGDWSHQIDIFRQIEIERLAAEEEILPSEERLDADEIESLLDDATGGYGEAYKLMAADYVSFFDDLVSSMLKLPLGLALHEYAGSEDYFVDCDLIYATISQRTARELLKKSSQERHRGLQSELSVTKEQLRALVLKPVSQWSAYELGALLASLIEDVDRVEYKVFCAMAEGSDCFFADSAIDWEKYEAAAAELRRSKTDDEEEVGSTAFLRSIPRAIRLALRTRKVRHPCEELSIAEIDAFNTLASGGEPIESGAAIAGLVRLGYLKATGWMLDDGGDGRLQIRHRYTIPISLHLAWCEWAWATSYAPRNEPVLATKPSPDQLSLFA
jgi:hypothetical protein